MKLKIMGADNKLLIISGAFLTAISFIFFMFDYIGYYFIASDPGTLFLLKLLMPYMWAYLLLSIAILIVGIVGRNREGYAIGGVALGITAVTLIYDLWYIFKIQIPFLSTIPPTMSIIIIISILLLSILIILGVVGGILKLLHGGQTGA
jgi:hypothetical protein